LKNKKVMRHIKDIKDLNWKQGLGTKVNKPFVLLITDKKKGTQVWSGSNSVKTLEKQINKLKTRWDWEFEIVTTKKSLT
jgi:hypothetical protein